MKLCISLPTEEVQVLDSYVRESGLASRSAGVRQALRLLHTSALEAEYAAAWQEWESSGEAELWETVSSDGLADAAG